MPIEQPKTQIKRNVALCYKRKSDIQGAVDFVSIVWQDETVEAECRSRDWVPEWYQDTRRHNSGRTEKNRSDWMRLRKRVGDPDVIAVIVAVQDRASRSVRDTAALIEDCIKYGVHFVAPAEGTDTTRTGWDAQTVLQLNLRASIAQVESDLASQRLKRRIKQYRGRGIPWGTPPFGMVRVGTGLSATLQADIDTPAAVSALKYFASGLSYEQAAKQLNANEIFFRDRKNVLCRFTHQSVRTIVSNTLLYAGYLITGENWTEKSSKIRLSGEGTYLQQYINACGGIKSPAIVPIIDHELANLIVERRVKSKYFKVSGTKWLPLLTPIVWSTEKRLRGVSRTHKNFYVSRGPGVYIDADIAEKNLLKKLEGIHFPTPMLNEIKRMIAEQVSDERRANLKKKRDDLTDQRSQLLRLFLQKQVNLVDYDIEYKRIEQALAAIQGELEKPTEVEHVLSQVSDIASTIQLMTREAQRRTIHRLFDRIELNHEGEVIGGSVKPWLYIALSELANVFNQKSEKYATVTSDGVSGNRTHYWLQQLSDQINWLITMRPRF
jgi:DNA invertase Pin-like site-specific DNA recombinase